jgi:2,5-diamino-6-(ribosylamino)-4(3H)-pyrimidinone 5'-phosphate reductase
VKSYTAHSKSETKARPEVILVAAMSLDGKIATRSGDSRISSKIDLRTLHKLRSQSDAVMIGIRTELIDNPLLTVRYVKGKSPIRVIVDSSARTPLKANILRTDPFSVFIAVSRKASASKVAGLQRAGARIIRCGKSKINLKMLLRTLYRRGIRRIVLEGGGILNWSMLREGLVDDVHITISPILIGGDEATTLVEGIGMSTINKSFRLRLLRVRRRENEITLEYKVNRNG